MRFIGIKPYNILTDAYFHSHQVEFVCKIFIGFVCGSSMCSYKHTQTRRAHALCTRNCFMTDYNNNNYYKYTCLHNSVDAKREREPHWLQRWKKTEQQQKKKITKQKLKLAFICSFLPRRYDSYEQQQQTEKKKSKSKWNECVCTLYMLYFHDLSEKWMNCAARHGNWISVTVPTLF